MSDIEKFEEKRKSNETIEKQEIEWIIRRMRELENKVNEIQERCEQEREYSGELFEKIKGYERALRRIAYCEFDGLTSRKLLKHITDFAAKTLRKNNVYV